MRKLVIVNPFDKPLIPERMVWTSSALKTFRSCKREFFWKYIFRLKRRLPDINLTIGTYFHRAMNMWYTRRRMQMAPLAKACTEELLNIFQTHSDAYDQDDYNKAVTAAEALGGTLRGYADMFSEDRKAKHETEVQFKIDCGEFDFAGSVDVVGRNFIMEHKTASNPNEPYFERLKLDTQVRAYLWGINAISPPAHQRYNVCYNVVRKCKLKRKSNEPLTNYRNRIADDYMSRPDFYFRREPLVFNKDELQEFEHELHETHREFTEMLNRHAMVEYDPRNWNINDQHCIRFFKLCPFHDLCTRSLDKATGLLYEQKDVFHEELEDE